MLYLNCPTEVLVTENPDYLSSIKNEEDLKETAVLDWKLKSKQMQKQYRVYGKSKFKMNVEHFTLKCEDREDFHLQNLV